VEAHYGAPQDTEWAIENNGQLWLTQARPITTLFPLPVRVPTVEDDVRVYVSVNVAQGVYRPFTPMGLAAFRVAGSSFATFVKLPPHDVLAGPAAFHVAASRIFFDLTPLLRHPIGRVAVLRGLSIMEARSGHIVQRLLADPRLSPIATSRWPFIRKLATVLLPSRIPLRVLQALLYPAAARRRMWRLRERLARQGEVAANASALERLAAVERLFLKNVGPTLLGNMPAIMGAGLGLQVIAAKLLGERATRDEIQTVLRSLPYNVTTEMDLELWKLAQQIRADQAASQVMLTNSLEQQVQAYQASTLPPTLQQGLAHFLHVYGHRAIAEIDMGLPRWSEDPAHILGVLANYLRLERPELAPDVQFQRGQREAEAMVTELTRRMRQQGGWLKSKLVHYCLSQVRALGGLRELPKFYLVQMMASARRLLWPVGEELVQAGRLEAAQDIFFIDLAEARAALAGQDFRAIVHERRVNYAQEMGRRHIPPVLLSDGTEPEAEHRALGGATTGALTGAPASAGVVTARARVIMNPVGARLEPGEILVAPSTDPGWTPLFLTAGGLVMEMGGSMSHGSVVAREYGIPAVVGVHGATERLVTGQRITVDGSNGVVIIEPEEV
jgi:rifampicin phosphotransferase